MPLRSDSEPDMSSTTTFRVHVVIAHLNASLIDGGDVDLLQYIIAYRELNRFVFSGYFPCLQGFSALSRFYYSFWAFASLGRLFQFVEKDVAEKEAILYGYVTGVDGQNYKTVRQMVAFEAQAAYKPDGCRTLLRLHRFVLVYFGGITTKTVVAFVSMSSFL